MRLCEGFDETLHALQVRFNKDSLSVAEFAEYLGICRQSASKILKGGKIQSIKCGNRYKIPLTQLARYECLKK